MIRLNKYLASSLSISRRKADEIISEGEVFLNSEVASIGSIVNIEKDIVTYQGNIIKEAEKEGNIEKIDDQKKYLIDQKIEVLKNLNLN